MKRGKATNRLLDYYLGIPVLNVLACFRRKRHMPAHIKGIGILVNPALGDTLLSSAVVQDVHALYPTASITLFCASSNYAAAALLPHVDKLEIIPITRPWNAIRTLRKTRLDILLDFTSWQRLTAFYALMSGARFTLGFKRKKQHRHRGYDATVDHRSTNHELENMRSMTRFLGATIHAAPYVVISEDVPRIVEETDKKSVVIHAWASGDLHMLREWPAERWVELAVRLQSPQRRFLLTGGPGDEARCQRLQQDFAACNVQADVLIGRGGLAQIAHVLRKAEVLISVNTGIMHLGAILGTPTVALNGPNAPHRWGPVGRLVSDVPTCDGSGGFLDLGYEFEGRNVMDKITVDSVVEAVQKLCPGT